VARAVFAVFSCLLGMLAIATALVLETVNRRAREIYLLLADHVISRRAARDEQFDPNPRSDRASRDRAP
jgi:hypothetical protein